MELENSPAVKIKRDIDYIAEACDLVSETLIHVGKFVEAGVATLELDKIAEDYICSHDAEPAFKGYSSQGSRNPFPYSLCISIDEEVVHGMPSSRRLKEGQIVSIDCGVRKEGFYGDSAYTFKVGEISAKKQRLLDVTLEALNRGVEQAVSGNTNYDIARAIQKYVEQNRFSCVRELVGHGVGTALHTDPCIPNFVPGILQRSKFEKAKLTAGMTIAIEPMVNSGTFIVHTANDGWTVYAADGNPSAHFEHTVLVESGKPIVLTHFS